MAIENLRDDPASRNLQRTLHSLVGVLGTAGAPCYTLARETEEMNRQQRLTITQLEKLIVELETLLERLHRYTAP